MVKRRRLDKRTPSPITTASKRKASVRSFRAAVRCMDGTRHRSLIADVGAAGAFDVLSDDCVVQVMRSVLAVATGPLGKSYFDNVDVSKDSFCALAISCKRLCNLVRSGYHCLQAEALARASTRITPRLPFSEDAFTVQMREELASCDHLKMLRAAQCAMTCHCASSCCSKYMRAFNKDVRTGNVFSRAPSPTLASGSPENSRMVSVVENCSAIAVCSSGTCAFAYMRERVSKRESDEEGRGRRFRDALVRVQENWPKDQTPRFVQTSKMYLEDDEMSPLLCMRCAPSGKSLAFTRSKHDVDPASRAAFGCAFFWTAGRSAHRVEAPQGCAHGVRAASLSAQDCWFTDVQGDEAIVVAWSTEFVHSSGHHMGSHASDDGPVYFFATYLIDQGVPEFFEATFAESGCLLTCYPSSKGDRVVTLDKRRGSTSKREVHIHDIRSGMCKSILTSPIVSCKGPVCAALSPSGDAVVAVHKPANEISVTVHVANDAGSFSPVQVADVSPYLSLHAADQEADFASDLVKKSLSIRFSPCSRFAAIVDRRPFFGMMAENNGVVVLDMALRMSESRSLRPFPMFPTADQAPRDFQWTRRGIWMLPPGTDDNGAIGARGGAVCLLHPRVDVGVSAPACAAEL